MAEFWTKERLYREVGRIRAQISCRLYPFDAKSLVFIFCKNPRLVDMDLESSKICGMLIRNKNSTVIGVNANHLPEQKNFYIAHELFHYLWHNDYKDAVRFCKEGEKRNHYAEWQANEAAAELLMPYRLFVPTFAYACKTSQFSGSEAIRDAKLTVAIGFGVTYRMAHMRVDTLKYAISQYINGTDISKVEILSNAMQASRGIVVKSYNEIEAELEIQEAFADQFDRYVRYQGI